MRTLVDVEALVADHLRDSNVAAGRVFTAVPRDPVFPLVVIQRLGGSPAIEQYLDVASIQIDAWAEREQDGGGGKTEAHDLAAHAQRACHEMRLALFTGAVVTAVEDESGLTWIPDPLTLRARYSLTIAFFVHPTREETSS